MKRALTLFLGGLFAALLALAALATLRVSPPARLTLEPEASLLGRRSPVRAVAEASGRGLTVVRLELVQADRVHVLGEKRLTARPPWAFWGPRTERVELSADAGSAEVRELEAGEAVLRVVAERATTWLLRPAPSVREVKLPVQLIPPVLQLVSAHHYVTQGGSEAVVYRVGPSSVRDGVLAGEWFFPGFPLPGGGKEDRFALFAVPYDLGDGRKVLLVAEDEVSNRVELAIVDRFDPRPFARDRIDLDDAFLRRVVPEILSHAPEVEDRGDLLETFLAINRELRAQNAKVLHDLGGRSAPRFLWREAFLPLPGSKVMSAFADRRTYLYQGREVDQQYHLGFDLASTRRVPVPAANDGVVVVARYFGIYGNAVVLDHGYGLLSLYGHLSSLDVAEGSEVKRGATLGRSGATGLAAGDHLHFTTLLAGLPVSPLEWWDDTWVRDRIAAKLGAAFPYEGPPPEVRKAAAPKRRPAAKARPKPKKKR